MERHEEALSDFAHAIELDPDLAWVMAQRGITYRVMERYEDALKDLLMRLNSIQMMPGLLLSGALLILKWNAMKKHYQT